MIGQICKIIKPFAMQTKKDGTTYGPAQLVEVELENGELTTTLFFEERAIGENIELEKNGQYWNVPKKPKKVVTVDFEPILSSMRLLYKQNTLLLHKVDKLLGLYNDNEDNKDEDVVEQLANRDTLTISSSTRTPQTPLSGYQKFQLAGNQLKGLAETTKKSDIINDSFDENKPINLEDIPF